MKKTQTEFNPFFDTPQYKPLDTYNVSLPNIWVKICRVLHKLHPYLSKGIITNTIIAKSAQMLTSKRITFEESGKKTIPNWFALILLESGGGKDRLVNDIDECIFADFRDWYKNEMANLKQKKKQEIPLELEDATQAGIYALAYTLSNLMVGSIFIKMPELGFYIKNANKIQLKYLSDLCKLADCKIPRTLTKSEGFTIEITNIPINALTYSDYTLFFVDIKDIFNSMLMSGLGRRFTISFQPQQEWICSTLSDEEETALRNELKQLGKELFNIFQKIEIGANYKLLPETKNILNDYKTQVIDLYNRTKNDMSKIGIRDRIYKALKLSCFIACIQHPIETVITEDDLNRSINTINFLSSDLEKFINYRPNGNDKDLLAFKFLKNNLGTGYSKTALVSELCKYCNYTRRGLISYLNKKGPDNFLMNLNEIASEYGYKLVKDTTKFPHGSYYYLQELDEELSFPQIISVNNEY